MKVVVIDITSRNAEQYNPSLCKALATNLPNGKVILMSPSLYRAPEGYKFKKLFNLVPKKFSSSDARWKRLLRALVSLFNYVYVIMYVTATKTEILHIQWLPFIEFIGGEKYFLFIAHKLNPRLKIFLTVHNIYPHLLSKESLNNYKKRFIEIDSHIDGYCVHLLGSKHDLINEFNIRPGKIFVTYHGIYEHEGFLRVKDASKLKGYKNIILFGMQNRYKGADLLIRALSLLPVDYLNMLRVKIVGKTDFDIYEECYNDAQRLNVEWINEYVPSNVLYNYIGESDMILLPYRKITQSGVLLLALSYRIPILTSDLPSFKETLEGYPEDYFFKADDTVSLRDILIDYLDGKIDESLIKERIETLNSKYSWNETGKSTVEAYRNILSK